MRLAVLIVTAWWLAACATPRRAVDPRREYRTETGFTFRFPMAGTWYPTTATSGLFVVGEAPAPDGSTRLALVRHGPIETPGGRSMSAAEMLGVFERNLEQEARGGRVVNVRSHFERVDYAGARCLAFAQTGDDHTLKGVMAIRNDGRVCLHPRRPYQFVWMALSARTYGAESRSGTTDREQFLNSLQFID